MLATPTVMPAAPPHRDADSSSVAPGGSPDPLIQVAGIRGLDEARMLANSGVTHLGYPLVLDHHEEDLPAAQVRDVIDAVGDAVEHVLITYLTAPRDIATLARFIGATWVQLHAPVTASSLRALREEAPELRLIKSVVFGREPAAQTIRGALELATHAHWLITDTFDPNTGASGATGRTHDWHLSAALVRDSPIPVILAGGLRPLNVASGIATVCPAGVDVHTGVEGSDGRKDPVRVRAFVDAAKVAFADIATVPQRDR